MMVQTQRARPGLAGSAGRALTTTTTMTSRGPVSTTLPEYTSSTTTASPFLNSRGQTVGFLVTNANGAWLEKRVKRAQHFFRKWKAWCIDTGHLERLRAMRASGVRLVVTDEGDCILAGGAEPVRREGLAAPRPGPR
jgi:hypothetical protein